MIRRLSFALLVPALVAAGPPAAVPAGSVTTLRLEPGAGSTEVTVEVSGGDFRVSDFRLSAPNRVVLDIQGARTALPDGGRWEGINRGGIAAVRTSQYSADVVRVVLVLQQDADYAVSRVQEGVRISLASGGGDFTPWSSAGGRRAAAPPAERARPAERAAAERPAQGEGWSAPQDVGYTGVSFTRVPPALDSARRIALQRQQPSRRITVTFESAEMRDVLASFAEYSGRSIIPGEEVASMRVEGVVINNQPWDEALRALLQAYGLAAVELPSGIIRVDRIENINARSQTEPLTTQPFRLNYVPVAEMQSTIEPLLTERGSIAGSATTNTLIVTDIAANVDGVAALLRQLDVRTPQVSIQAKIVFINRTDAEELGVSYDLKDSRGNSLNRLVQVEDPRTGDLTNSNLISLGGNSIAALGNANQRVQNAALETVMSLVLGRYTLITFLDALQTAELSDVQAAPVVTTVNNREASIWVGEKTPIRVVDLGNAGGGAGGGAANQAPRATAELVETGIKLIVTPQVTSDRQILMQIHAERSSAQTAVNELGVQFFQQQGDTRVLVNDGETAVIGGLTVTEVTSTRNGIPFLMDIPVVGGLFRRTSSREQKRDLLIMVTPHIVDEGE
jgi:type IV pilus assembly protein PilQ